MYNVGDDDEYVRRWTQWQELAPHRSAWACRRRFAVLHSGKLLIAAACYAAIRAPDVVGLVYQVGVR